MSELIALIVSEACQSSETAVALSTWKAFVAGKCQPTPYTWPLWLGECLVSVYFGSVTMRLACSVLFVITLLVGEYGSRKSSIASLFHLKVVVVELLLLKLRR